MVRKTMTRVRWIRLKTTTNSRGSCYSSIFPGGKNDFDLNACINTTREENEGILPRHSSKLVIRKLVVRLALRRFSVVDSGPILAVAKLAI